jgi:hypothetical protein
MYRLAYKADPLVEQKLSSSRERTRTKSSTILVSLEVVAPNNVSLHTFFGGYSHVPNEIWIQVFKYMVLWK